MNRGYEPVILKWNVLGAMLANLSDIEQTKFFQSFANEMIAYPTQHQIDSQLSTVQLTDVQKEIYLSLGFKND